MRATFLIAALAVCMGLGSMSKAEEAPKTFPAFKLKKVAGGTLDSESLKGKPAVLNLWATW